MDYDSFALTLDPVLGGQTKEASLKSAYPSINNRGLGCVTNLHEIMHWQSFDVACST